MNVSPLNAMMCSCFFGVVLSSTLIMMRDSNKFQIEKLSKFGIHIPTSDVVYQHRILGIKAGLVGLVPVVFGSFALNYTCIPLYLAFRRCGLLSSVVVMYFWDGEKPTRAIIFSTLLVTTGAITAAWEEFEAAFIGFLCVWSYNFSQSFQNVYISVLNKGKILTPFEFNYFFSIAGFTTTFAYNFVFTSDYKQLLDFSEDQ